MAGKSWIKITGRRRAIWLFALLTLAFLLSRWPGSSFQEKVISYDQADKFINQFVTVEGTIVRTHNSGKACFLNFHPDYRRYLSLVIFASDFPRFPASPEKYYLNKKVRVKGRIKLYQGRPEIILSSPSQIVILEDGSPEKGKINPVEKISSEAGQTKHFEGPEEGGDSEKLGIKIPEISWEEAGNYYGQKVRVRGRVVAASNTGRVCFLNFHRNWRRYFTVVIFASSFDRFPEPPEKYYLGREIRVLGVVKEYRGKPEIVVESPEQIEILN